MAQPEADVELNRWTQPSQSPGHDHDIEHAVADEAVPSGHVAPREDIPPDGGYGWVCTACFFLIQANTFGVNSAWAVFLAHYIADSTFPGASQLEYALIGGLSISQAFVIGSVVNFTVDKIGPRLTMGLGTVIVSAALLGTSYATQTYQLFLSFGLFLGWGSGFLFITASNVLPHWFARRRSLAQGLASAGVGFGGLAYSLGTGAALETIGAAWTYRIFAICTLIVNSICVFLLKDRSRGVRAQRSIAFDLGEYRHISVLLITAWGIMTEFGYSILSYTLPNYATSIGLSVWQGSVVAAALNLGLAFGRPAVGYCSDRYGRINVATISTALCGVLCFAIWVPAKTYAALIVFALLSGTISGTFWSCVVPVTAEVVGLQHMSTAFAMIVLPLALPTTFGEPIALHLVSSSGYLSSQAFVGVMFFGAAASTWLLRSWKVCQSDRVRSDRGFGLDWLQLRGLTAVKKV